MPSEVLHVEGVPDRLLGEVRGVGDVHHVGRCADLLQPVRPVGALVPRGGELEQVLAVSDGPGTQWLRAAAAAPLNTHECVTVASPWSAACSGPKGWASSYQAASYWARVTSGAGADRAGRATGLPAGAGACPACGASPDRAASTIAAAHACPWAAVSANGAGCGACANWFTSLPMVIPSRFGRSATACGERPDVVGGRRDDVRVGEHVAAVPAVQPRRQEVEARQVSLQRVDVDVEAERAGDVDDGGDVVQRRGRISVRFGCTTGQSGKIRTWSAPRPAMASRSRAVSEGEKSSHEWNHPIDGVWLTPKRISPSPRPLPRP